MRHLVLIAALALLASGCGGDSAPSPRTAAAGEPSCPKAWRTGWQRLANDVGSPVYCPSWMPPEVDGKIGGRFKNGRWVDEDRSYLVSFLWVDHDAGVSREVHVNFRGYPGRTSIPTCESTHTVKGRTIREPIPCFSDPQPKQRRLGDITATVYTVNQGIDEWHVLYAWRRDGSLYTVSQHVVSPYSYRRVVENLDRIARGLVTLEPNA
ncbi:MAG TPA: hypothetical protein VFR32_01160 [Gaiellaceae bacterium]|nr:hypothetical protein [Gaiellaceae bacterium]